MEPKNLTIPLPLPREMAQAFRHALEREEFLIIAHFEDEIEYVFGSEDEKVKAFQAAVDAAGGNQWLVIEYVNSGLAIEGKLHGCFESHEDADNFANDLEIQFCLERMLGLRKNSSEHQYLGGFDPLNHQGS